MECRTKDLSTQRFLTLHSQSGSEENLRSARSLDQTAVAKVTASWGVDYMLLGKHDGQWKIQQILWQSPPPKKTTLQ